MFPDSLLPASASGGPLHPGDWSLRSESCSRSPHLTRLTTSACPSFPGSVFAPKRVRGSRGTEIEDAGTEGGRGGPRGGSWRDSACTVGESSAAATDSC